MNINTSLKQRLLRIFLNLYTNSPGKKSRGKKHSTLSQNGLSYAQCSIIITTFEKRFFEFALPLLISLRAATNIPITVVINGNFDSMRDDETYRSFVTSTQKYSNVSLVTFNTFHGWASMLNAGILHSDTDVSFVFNDDVYLNPNLFGSELSTIIEEVQNSKLVLMNNSWSHFAITRECLAYVGFFDEHFLGIGQEDGDYAIRYKSTFSKDVPTIKVSGLVNFVDQSRDESIGVTNGKYSLFNSVYLGVKLSRNNGSAESTSHPDSEGSLRSIYTWRKELYKSLGWMDQKAIHSEILQNEYLKNIRNVRGS
jgi:hypothetical protein